MIVRVRVRVGVGVRVRVGVEARCEFGSWSKTMHFLSYNESWS